MAFGPFADVAFSLRQSRPRPNGAYAFGYAEKSPPLAASRFAPNFPNRWTALGVGQCSARFHNLVDTEAF